MDTITNTIHCNHIDNVAWNNDTDCLFIVTPEPDIWQIAIDENLHLIAHYWSLLNADEHIRAGRYYHEKDKNRFIISRGYLRKLLGQYTRLLPHEIIFETPENKKPYIKNAHADIHFNVSHSGNYILIAVASADVGVDVEIIDANFPYQDVLTDSFSNKEIHEITASHNPIDTFYKLWTRKEALLKATGKGIDDSLPFIPCLNGSNTTTPGIIGSAKSWFVNSFKVDDGYIGSIAALNAKSKFWK